MALLVHHPLRRGTLQGLAGRLGHSRVLKVVEGTEKAFPAQGQLKEVTKLLSPRTTSWVSSTETRGPCVNRQSPPLTLANFMVT